MDQSGNKRIPAEHEVPVHSENGTAECILLVPLATENPSENSSRLGWGREAGLMLEGVCAETSNKEEETAPALGRNKAPKLVDDFQVTNQILYYFSNSFQMLT